jgi:hypothetical protein
MGAKGTQKEGNFTWQARTPSQRPPIEGVHETFYALKRPDSLGIDGVTWQETMCTGVHRGPQLVDRVAEEESHC